MRYHLSKELEEHRLRVEKSTKHNNALNNVVPVFAATVTILASLIFQKLALPPNISWWSIVLIGIIGIPICFVAVYFVTKGFLLLVTKKIPILLKNIGAWASNKPIKKLDAEEIKEFIHQFNYEVVNLAYLSYSLAKEKSDDPVVQSYKTMESVFYLKTAVYRTHKVFSNIVGQIKVDIDLSSSRIKGVFDLFSQTILLLKESSLYPDFKVDIDFICSQYNMLVTAFLSKDFEVEVDRV